MTDKLVLGSGTEGMERYISRLCGYLNISESPKAIKVSGHAVYCTKYKFATVILAQHETGHYSYESCDGWRHTLARMAVVSLLEGDGILELMGCITFDGTTIYILKPLTAMSWTDEGARHDASGITHAILAEKTAKAMKGKT